MRKVLLTGTLLITACGGQGAGLGTRGSVGPATSLPGQDLIAMGAGGGHDQGADVEEPTSTTTVVVTSTTRRSPTTLARELPTLDYGEWAIPKYIVACETGGTFDWYAYNASGASGPYQLMRFHFGGELAMNQSRAAQHQKAAELWNGGRGKSHWEECL